MKAVEKGWSSVRRLPVFLAHVHEGGRGTPTGPMSTVRAVVVRTRPDSGPSRGVCNQTYEGVI